ncbi:hypothetical protein [Streptomyces virginiae]|uniref:hypothetical protein n=1 Tax=Streptomyces virginiae TaxID=1961 RepID=UPI00177AA8BD|nr:hypothetical protein [Streptomyces virginiae]MBP2341928.1 hypothetical protein [Streptomyces virginiae]
MAPLWGQVEPFVLASASQLWPPPPDLYGTYEKLLASDDHQRQVGAARTAGADKPTGRTPVMSRTPDREVPARLWEHDEDGTCKPPGQFPQATREIATHRKLNTDEDARLFVRLDREGGHGHRGAGRVVPDPD